HHFHDKEDNAIFGLVLVHASVSDLQRKALVSTDLATFEAGHLVEIGAIFWPVALFVVVIVVVIEFGARISGRICVEVCLVFVPLVCCDLGLWLFLLSPVFLLRLFDCSLDAQSGHLVLVHHCWVVFVFIVVVAIIRHIRCLLGIVTI